jgi:cyclophilin family peptidyl-prolyl cis-trans isomerase
MNFFYSLNLFVVTHWLCSSLIFSSAATAAFVIPQTTTTKTTTTTTTTELLGHANQDIDRRGFFLSKVLTLPVLSAAVSSISAPFIGTAAFAADDEASTAGRLIEFEVENLDGGGSGKFVVKTRPDWAPIGVERFETLTANSFWDGCRVFRVLPGFVAQFGINGDPTVQSKWRSTSLRDDPVKVTNSRGTVVFATAGPNTRTTQIFINTNPKGNGFLDKQGFSPIGEVVEGMDVVDKFYAGYGEGAPSGKGPNQALIQTKGNAYLEPGYPLLSYFKSVKFLN